MRKILATLTTLATAVMLAATGSAPADADGSGGRPIAPGPAFTYVAKPLPHWKVTLTSRADARDANLLLVSQRSTRSKADVPDSRMVYVPMPTTFLLPAPTRCETFHVIWSDTSGTHAGDDQTFRYCPSGVLEAD